MSARVANGRVGRRYNAQSIGMKQMKVADLAQGIERVVFPVVRFLDRITWCVLVLMMLMTMADVLLRKLTNITIIGAGEMTEMMMAVVVFCSLAQCQVDDGHIKIDLIMGKTGPRTRAVADFITQGACFILFCLVTWGTLRHGLEIRAWEEVSIDLGIPIYPFVFVAAAGCLLLALILLFKTLLAWVAVRQR